MQKSFREARQNPSLLRKQIFSCSSNFATRKNPQCISDFGELSRVVDTSPAFAKATAGEVFIGPDVALAKAGAVFSHHETRISTQPPLSRYGQVLPRSPRGYLSLLVTSGLLFAGCGGGAANKGESHHEQSAAEDQVKEPHSFDVSVSAECRGKNLSWEYSSPEGRVSISKEVAESSGVKVERAAVRKIARTLRIRGKILPSEHRLAHVMPRFAGVVKEGRKHIGDPVQKGEVLAIIESNQSLQPFEVRSQISGTVISGHLIVGEFVPENHLVYTVADLSEVWADFFVPLKDRSEVKIGQKVLIRAVGQEQTVEGVVSYLAPYADEKSQAQLVRAIIPNQSGALLAGTFVAGDLIVEELEAPVAVKRSAVQRFRSWDVVFLRFGDTYEARPVVLGRGDDQYVEILSGLKANEEYVSENSFLIKADILKSGASHDH